MPLAKPGYQYLAVKMVDGVAVITFLESAAMMEGDKVDGLAKELFDVIDTKKYTKVVLNLYNAGYMSSAMLGAAACAYIARCRSSRGKCGCAPCVRRSWTRSR